MNNKSDNGPRRNKRLMLVDDEDEYDDIYNYDDEDEYIDYHEDYEDDYYYSQDIHEDRY
ncbi:MAG: hypothetical protein JW891_18370 [Candidatus Lokiarchaeota archaeon]|nr:hypothetical protein [Candidatus Lokiarchaeota archaeon]